ncbi:MAG TPA: sulfite exporter TauE/SafE family protein [Nevskiaceae bacterium]|nr:sulfite exporter TauE/SafE family protein [Nevskiaceae bacterium]
MPIPFDLIAELAGVGIFTGFVAGLFGIGGGGIMVPFLLGIIAGQGVATGLAMKMAVATSLSVIVFTSASSALAHYRNGNLRRDLFAIMVPGIVVGDLIASLGASRVITGEVIAIVFAVFLLVVGTRMLLNSKTRSSHRLPSRPGLFGAGGLIGFVSGLLGIGGGSLTVPFLSYCNVDIRQAVGTSAGLGFPIALVGAIGYTLAGHGVAHLPVYSFGYLWLPGLVIIATCTVTMAPVGAAAANALPVARLKRLFALLLWILGIYMVYQAITS